MSHGEWSKCEGRKWGDKRRVRENTSSGALSPEGREKEMADSPDRSEDVLFCFSSALPLPAGSNIMLGTKAMASVGQSALVPICAVHKWDETLQMCRMSNGIKMKCRQRPLKCRGCPYLGNGSMPLDVWNIKKIK